MPSPVAHLGMHPSIERSRSTFPSARCSVWWCDMGFALGLKRPSGTSTAPFLRCKVESFLGRSTSTFFGFARHLKYTEQSIDFLRTERVGAPTAPCWTLDRSTDDRITTQPVVPTPERLSRWTFAASPSLTRLRVEHTS